MIVDSNILVDVLNPRDDRSLSVANAYLMLCGTNTPKINAIIFAEACSRFTSLPKAEQAVSDLNLAVVDFTLPEAFRAGQAFQLYRNNRGPRTSILPDFLIGAQASVRGWPILTRDPARFASYFPEVELIDPLKVEND